MSKNPFVSKILSLSLVLALLASTPVNAYASSIDEEAVAEATTIEESISEDSTDSNETVSEASTEGTSDPDEISDGDSAMNSDNETIEDGEAVEPEDIDDDSNEDSDETDEDCDHEYIVLTYSDDDIDVKITATKDVLGDIVGVEASAIDEGDEYSSIEASLAEDAENSGKSLLAFVAYDIRLVDVDGNEQEPDGTVSVQMTSKKTPESDESLDGANIGLVHFADSNDSTDMVELTGDDNTSIETNDSSDNVDVEFTTDSFSTYAVTWLADSYKVGTIKWTYDNETTKVANIYAIDEDGNGLSDYITSKTISYELQYNQDLSSLNLTSVDGDYFEAIANSIYIFGYEYESAYAANAGKQLQELENLHYYYVATGSSSNGWAYYLSSNTENNFYYFLDDSITSLTVDTINIYLKFKKQEVTTQNFAVDLFQYNDTYYINNETAINYVSSLNAVDGKYLEMNFGAGTDSYNKNHYDGAYQGLADSKLDADGMISFSNYGTPYYFKTDNYDSSKTEYYSDSSKLTVSGTDIKYNTGYYNVSFPFQVCDGYYSFDSSVQSAKYTIGEDSVTVTDDADSNGFWPFGTSAGDADHFGMHFTTDFYMTSIGTYDGKDCVFKFSGDDDVWVYIDGVLVLDLGGIHDEVSGTINFATGEVTVSKIYHSSGNGTSYNMYTDGILGKSATLNNGLHSLQVYYLERGSSQSNCSIVFNMPTVDSTGDPVDVSFTKKNSQTGLCLKGAEFELCDSDGNKVGDSVTSDASGNVTFENVECGVYTLKEIYTSTGYEKPSHTWTVKVYYVNGVGKFDIENDDDTSTDLEYDSEEGYIIYNTPSTDSYIVADKTAEVLDWNDRTYKITLSGNALVEDVSSSKSDVVLVIDVSGSMLFPNDLSEYGTYNISNLDKSKTYYYVTNDSAATVYTVQYTNKRWQYKDSSYVYLNTEGGWTKITSDSKVINTKTDYKFYTSPSNGSSIRFTDTKNAAKEFIDILAEHNSDNRVSIVTFAKSTSNVTKVQIGLTKLDSTNVTNLKNKIDSLTTDGGTNQYAGLEKASEVLSSREKSEKESYNSAIVLISDGTINESVSDSYKTERIKAAKENAKVYTVGIDLDFSDSVKKNAGALLDEIATSGHYINAGQTGLKAFLTGIAYDILNIGGNNGSVIDEIDSRFELIDSDGNTLSDGDTVVGYVLKDGIQTEISGVVKSSSSGMVYIQWQTDCLLGFYSEFYVRAKDDFMGGNVILTNGAGSRISSGTKTEYFPQPTVNVRLYDLSLSDNELTILLGDELSVKTYVENLLDTLVCYDGNSEKQGVIKGIDFDTSVLFDDDSSNDYIEYSYKGDGDVVGKIYLTLTKNDKANSLTYDSKGIGIADEVGDDIYVYRLGIKYVANDYASRKDAVGVDNTTILAPTSIDIDQGYVLVDDVNKLSTNKTSIKAAEGKYVVNIVDAGLLATKISSTQDGKKLSGAEYRLSVKSINGYEISDLAKSITSDKNGLMSYNGLGVGEFLFVETKAPSVDGMQYALSSEEFTVSIYRSGVSQYSIYVYSSNSSQPLSSMTFDVSDELMGSINDTYSTPETHIVEFTAKDNLLYTLPETGGRGVYVYIIGGILLMLVGALLLYKNKKSNNK